MNEAKRLKEAMGAAEMEEERERLNQVVIIIIIIISSSSSSIIVIIIIIIHMIMCNLTISISSIIVISVFANLSSSHRFRCLVLSTIGFQNIRLFSGNGLDNVLRFKCLVFVSTLGLCCVFWIHFRLYVLLFDLSCRVCAEPGPPVSARYYSVVRLL